MPAGNERQPRHQRQQQHVAQRVRGEDDSLDGRPTVGPIGLDEEPPRGKGRGAAERDAVEQAVGLSGQSLFPDESHAAGGHQGIAEEIQRVGERQRRQLAVTQTEEVEDEIADTTSTRARRRPSPSPACPRDSVARRRRHRSRRSPAPTSRITTDGTSAEKPRLSSTTPISHEGRPSPPVHGVLFGCSEWALSPARRLLSNGLDRGRRGEVLPAVDDRAIAAEDLGLVKCRVGAFEAFGEVSRGNRWRCPG